MLAIEFASLALVLLALFLKWEKKKLRRELTERLKEQC